ncbi:hypothetical protein [Oligoflexus tunisiensis]|uniref:hypothetical protein n=1 Tax=Oligoflexus tunisiensis TaxID=708132 RepID=UPI00114CCADB|nr:hypothetical protein [Oligoflexus tunisiensis]
MRLLFLVSWMASLLLVSGLAQAFPDTVRHGYASCAACHVSVAGGGTLTAYGRALAAEFMSTWAREDEGLPLHGGVKKIPDALLIGGGFRSVQTYTDNPKFRQGRYFLMQSDVELGWSTERLTFLASFGRDINLPDDHDDDEWVSARHYLAVNINDNLSVRVGKFMKNYGLSIPNHTAQIRGGLGWEEFSETYNAEVNYLTENYVLSFTGIGGRPDDDDEESEKGFTASGQILHLDPNIRLGASYFAGRATDETNREIFGPHFTWGVTKRIFLLGEYDWVRLAPKTGELIEGYVTYTQAGIEVVRGLDLTIMHEMKKNDRQEKKIAFQGYGPGLRWQPRPHFILTGQWQKQRTPQYAKLVDSAWLVMQYWL